MTSSYRIPLKMSRLEKDVFNLISELNPAELYGLGLDEFAGRVFVMSKDNIQDALSKIASLKKECRPKNLLVKKFLDSIEATLLWDEPAPGVGQITQTLSTYLIKEGFNAGRLTSLVELLTRSLRAWLEFLNGKEYTVPVKILAQYQVIGAVEILDIIQRESKDLVLDEKISELRVQVEEFRARYAVPGFTDGEFSEVERIMMEQGADLKRAKFYPQALKRAFDYSESWKVLERKALRWMDEELPKFRKATKRLSKKLNCNNDPMSVQKKLAARPGMNGKQALETTIRIRPVVQSLVGESIVGINPLYEARVVETPPYLTPIIPSAAAQGFDGLTSKPYQLYYMTTDPKRSPPNGLADLIDTLVHEEYGHCVHFSNTAAGYAAKASIVEILPSLHSGTTSEGLSFQRELEFLELLLKISKKKSSEYTRAEGEFVQLMNEYGGFEQFLDEIGFEVHRFRMVRFLRVIGDTRINSGKQNLLEFLNWAEKKTGLSPRSLFYQLFPGHEGIFPGYATCYAIVGQDIRAVQRILKNDSKKLVKFNAYATSMGYPARSIYLKRLKDYAKKLSRSK